MFNRFKFPLIRIAARTMIAPRPEWTSARVAQKGNVEGKTAPAKTGRPRRWGEEARWRPWTFAV